MLVIVPPTIMKDVCIKCFFKTTNFFYSHFIPCGHMSIIIVTSLFFSLFQAAGAVQQPPQQQTQQQVAAT